MWRLEDAGRGMVIIGVLLAGAQVLVSMINLTGIGVTLSSLIVALAGDSVVLVAGIFLETASALIILTPMLLPLAAQLGIDTVHFGIIIIVGLAIGMVTPPVAINLFVASTTAGLPIEKITRAVLPYLAVLLVVYLLIAFVPMLF